MQISVFRPRRRSVLAAVVVATASVAALNAAAAGAKPVTANLRVEANGKSLSRGNAFVTDTVSLATDPTKGCDGSGKTVTLAGPTALGLVKSAADAAPALAPVAVSDKFSFGLLLCGIGGVNSTSFDNYWLYKVNH